MKIIKTDVSKTEATYDPSVIKFKNKLYVIFSQEGPELSLILKDTYDTETNKTSDLVLSTDKLLEELRIINEIQNY